jgi:hypothetical protein
MIQVQLQWLLRSNSMHQTSKNFLKFTRRFVFSAMAVILPLPFLMNDELQNI